MGAERKFYSIKQQAGADTAEIYIYDQIGENWWTGGGITALNFIREISALNVRNINVRINSPGGSVFDGHAIYNALKRHPANITTYNDSEASSIASVIFLAGNKKVMASNALFMIHLPTCECGGDASDMRKMADLLDACRDTAVAVYRENCSMTDAEIIAAMEAETYYTAEQALAIGFIDEIGVELKLAACAGDRTALGYRRPPENHVVTVEVEVKVGDGTSDTEIEAPDEPDNPTAQAAATKAPVAAHQEVVVMTVAATAPANGARDFSKEAVEIVTMCNTSGCSDRAAGFISAQLSPDQAGKQILDLFHSGAIAAPAAEAAPLVDMGRNAKNYSYAKAIAAGLELREGRTASGFEVEIHQEICKKLPQNYAAKGGIFVPQRVQNTALTTTGTNTGKETVFQEYGEFIDILRNMMGTTRMGARILTGLVGPIAFPKQTGASTLYWTGENSGSDVTVSNVTFGSVTMSPKTCMATGALSRQLIIQSTPDVEGIIRNDLAMIHALGWDLAAIHGTGQNNQPLGLYGQASVNAVAMGGVPTFGKLVDMATAIATYNALFGNTGFLTNPLMAGKLMQTLVASAAGSRMIWEGTHIEGVVAGFSACATNQVSAALGSGNDEIGILFGNWSDLMIGMWGALEILVDPYSMKKQGLLEITSFQMADVAARRGESFSKATGAKIA